MTDAFSDLVMPIFRQVIDLKDGLSLHSPTLPQVRQQTLGWIATADKQARGDERLDREFKMARYGLVAWIDEILTDSSWGQSVGWGSQKNILEWDLYQSIDRASRFYEMSETAYAAVDRGRSSADPLEVYLLCVALGFLGVLGSNEPQLYDWVERFDLKISETSPMDAKPFSDDSASSLPRGLKHREGPELLLRVSVLTAITALATLIAYLIAVHVNFSV